MNNDENRVALYQLAYQLSQEKLASQADAAIGADARAMSFAGLCFTAAAVLLSMGDGNSAQIPLIVGASLLLIAGGIAAYSARPITFRFPGANFEDLRDDLNSNIDLIAVIEQMAVFCEKHIKENTENIEKNSKYLREAVRVAALGIGIPILYNFFTLL